MKKLSREKLVKYCDRTIEICLYILIFCLPFSKAIVEISATTAIVVWIFKRIFSEYIKMPDAIYERQKETRLLRLIKTFKPVHTDLNIPILTFVVISSISLINTNHIYKSLEGFFFRWLEYVMLYFIITETINSRKRFKNVLITMLVSGGIIGIDGIIQYFTGTDLLRRQPLVYERMTASFGYYNTFAMYLEAIIPIYICLALFGLRNKKIKWIVGLAAILLLVCLGLTHSRGGWLAFLVALIFIGILRDKRILIGLIILICILPFILPNSIKERIAITVRIEPDTGQLIVTDGGRFTMWKAALRMIKDRPFFGHGLNTYMYNYPKYRTDGVKESDLAHNCYLMIAAETGLIGFTMFMWIIVVLFKRTLSCLKSLKKQTREQLEKLDAAVILGLLAAIVANLVHSFVDNNLQTLQTATLFWFIVGLVVSLQKIVKLQNSQQF